MSVADSHADSSAVLTVQQCMSTDMARVRAGDPLSLAAAQIARAAASCALVTEGERLIGIVTERDIVRLFSEVSPREFRSLTLADVMTAEPVRVVGSTTIEEAASLMRRLRIRRLPVTSNAGALIGLVTESDIAWALIENARDIRGPITERLVLHLKELEAQSQTLAELAYTDSLLNIGNRRRLTEDAEQSIAQSQRYCRPHAIVLIDVDCFKQYNDCYGHPEGDRALQGVVAVLQAQLRSADRLYRYGGEELAVLLPETDEAGAFCAAERMVRAVHDRRIEHRLAPHGVVTISAGTTQVRSGDTVERILRRADRALYAAKGEGRNCARLPPGGGAHATPPPPGRSTLRCVAPEQPATQQSRPAGGEEV